MEIKSLGLTSPPKSGVSCVKNNCVAFKLSLSKDFRCPDGTDEIRKAVKDHPI